MADNPLVSVIVPVFDVAPYFAEALDSLIDQTYKNLEILLIDDGSTDGSGVLCNAYAEKDKRILVVHQENKGLSAARNAGLDRITGDVIAYLDPDDAYENTFIEKMLAVMMQENADMTICRYTLHRTTEKMKREGETAKPLAVPGRYNRVQGLCALADGNINVTVWNKLYRRELWQSIRFPDGHVHEDVDTAFRVFDLCKTIYVLDEPLFLHRKRSGSITDTVSMKNRYDYALACSHFASFIEGHIRQIFTLSQAKKWRKLSLNGLLISYVHFSQKEAQALRISRDELRNQIISYGKRMGIHSLGFRTGTAWYLIYICPWLFRILYPVYYHARLLVSSITRSRR